MRAYKVQCLNPGSRHIKLSDDAQVAASELAAVEACVARFPYMWDAGAIAIVDDDRVFDVCKPPANPPLTVVPR